MVLTCVVDRHSKQFIHCLNFGLILSYIVKGSTYQVVFVYLLEIKLIDELEDCDRFTLF
jgi:hypothetical protein